MGWFLLVTVFFLLRRVLAGAFRACCSPLNRAVWGGLGWMEGEWGTVKGRGLEGERVGGNGLKVKGIARRKRELRLGDDHYGSASPG